ncbi:MAG TPA: Ig domain-containing protein [Verrucomicrobiae bacterium]|jgi:hypothetical protein|nr:Ig domain-containing protein [Verrucomicrobiae bacterium]
MKSLRRILPALGLLFSLPLLGQPITVVQFSQTAATLNLQSQRGQPISTSANASIGSDGAAPGIDSSTGGTANLTLRQFAGLLSFGGVTAASNNLALQTTNPYLQGTNGFSAVVAQNMQLPMGADASGVQFIMRRGQVGAPYISQPISFYFGSVIPAPATDVHGTPLTNSAAYWLTKPANYNSYTNGSANAYFYYSPNAGAVFATQPGQISVTWVTFARYTGTNIPSYTNRLATAGIPNYVTNSDNSVSLLYTQNYLVSPSPAKAPQTIYWTEDSFANTGHPVVVPSGQITALNVIYNSQIPPSVTTPYSSTIPGVTNLNTLWYDSQHGLIRAFNKTGRVFVEMVGQPTANGNYQFLGDEIVDVQQAPIPAIITNYLGNFLTPYQDPGQGANLIPSPINNLGKQFYYFDGVNYYADQATANVTDLQLYWLTTGVAGLQWPYVFDDCALVWPNDPAQYSFYLRPNAASKAQAALTAVQLDQGEDPSIDYQDALDQPRAFLTGNSTFYTWLNASYPAQRVLLRFNANGQVRFERVFSCLAQGLQNNVIFNQSVMTNLSAWNAGSSTLTNYASSYNPPHVYNSTVNVGDQIIAPPGEYASNAAGDYWAGYINTNVNATFVNTNIGASYHPGAYVDPFANGFAAANQGAIIPVNSIPGHNQLEVWWFRPNDADNAAGFQTVYWPAVVGDYTIQWPSAAPTIVLAGNAGSGPLDSQRATGSIYFQNDPTQPGYNPNEEHAIMLGGQAYALRDDLNITNATNNSLPWGGYSSAPFVLLNYTGSDGRPAMSVFQVERENPAAGVYFDYVVTAGTQLQPPMPLPLLEPPVANGTNYDVEPSSASGDVPAGWNANVDPHGPYALYSAFTFQDRKNNFWVYRGLHAGLPPLQAGSYNPTNNTFDPLPDATAVVGDSSFNYFIHVSRQLDSLTVGMADLPPGLSYVEDTTNGLSITGTPTENGSYPVTITLTDTADGSEVTLPLQIDVVDSGAVSALGPLVLNSANQYSGQVDTFSNRPPALAQPASPSNSFTMRFYYKTLPGFAWPSLGNASNWPAVGSIVPYLRPLSNGVYVGSPGSSKTPSLDIVYRPVWPELQNGQPLPSMSLGQTLTTPVNGLAAVRGQSSVQVLYQQSIATNGAPLAGAPSSVTLFDPTVQKKSSLAAIHGLPSSVQTDPDSGFLFFPTLPPNLINRVWYDPNTVTLNLKGQFISDPVNGDYLMLNVLRDDDLAAVNGLCSSNDSAYPAWIQAVAGLSTPEFSFHINTNGAYVIDPSQTVTRQAGDLVEVTNSDTAVDSYALSASGPGLGYVTYIVENGLKPSDAGNPISVYVTRVALPLFPGALVLANGGHGNPFSQVITFQHTADLAGRTSQYRYDWRVEPPVNGQPPPLGSEPSWTPLPQAHPGPVLDFGASGIQGISDNYISMRYGYLQTNNGVVSTNWAPWANPILAEGWITRVTQAIDPIAGQTQNLYNNPASTTANLIQLAGTRWNGNVPLNASSLTNSGLIQLYETVLNMGESLSINSGINYGPANQALLTAAGYLNDLYMTLGNAAWANSLNPTIGFGTDNQTYGAVATASFCFEGEVPTLLDQNLALLRGRDDSLSPGVLLPPVYNRLYWNYTYGLNAGQVIYALNYNITDQNGDGAVNAADAQIMFPQGHGDAYGHYLTAMMNYYKLLMNPYFDWVPQAQTVLVLGAAVTVNYENETKFAAAAGAVARTGRQIFDLTWRESYAPGTAAGWSAFSTNHTGQYPYVDNNGATRHVTRYWGLDHWAARVGQGTYLNWLVGNSLLPYTDSNPNDQGVQVVDRQTVPELSDLPATAAALESDMDNANAGFTPLGLAQNAIPFDIDPALVTGANPQTHFEQVYARAVQTLNNAVVAFNAAQNVTQQLRQQQNSLSDLQAAVSAQELAYNDQLIELYGSPYPEDIGPGATYPDGYTGPDLLHYMYVDNVSTNTFGGILPDPTVTQSFQIDMQQLPADWATKMYQNFDFYESSSSGAENFDQNTDYIVFNVGPDGFSKPSDWTEARASTGSIQTAAAAVNAANDRVRQACYNAQSAKQSFDKVVAAFNSQVALQGNDATLGLDNQSLQTAISLENDTLQVGDAINNYFQQSFQNTLTVASSVFPNTLISGLADGGDFWKALEAFPLSAIQASATVSGAGYIAERIAEGAALAVLNHDIQNNNNQIATNDFTINLQNTVLSLGQQLSAMQGCLTNINLAQQELSGAEATYQTLVAQGSRIQSERQTFRQHTAAQVQGYTVADAAFLVFQNEDLERYTTLFNLAAQYAYMAANAYDYETGLLNTPAGRSFLNQIVSSCALGVIQNGQPQISGTDTGDPGLANALAEMNADWQALKGRLGFNNPDGYGTIASLRSENYRVLPGASGDAQWQQLLNQSVLPDLRADSDVVNNCLQLDDGSGQAVPGIELTFGTTITDGQNLFGQILGPGDHSFSSSSFATKIFAIGVCFDGYVGMDNPVAYGSNNPGAASGPNALAATPYVYLIPCGADSMRSPPLGDTSAVRTWNVDDVAIPLPFNIGASDFAATPFYTAADSLSEPLLAVRKQQAFRPVSTTDAFSPSIYGAGGMLQPSQFTNRRLIGRSVWNSRWKLIIPGRNLLNDPTQGLARFINTVKDVHLYFLTYSYAGN